MESLHSRKLKKYAKEFQFLRIDVQNYTNKMLTSDFYSWYSLQHKVKNSKKLYNSYQEQVEGFGPMKPSNRP
ncbi:hypothetical protein BCN_3943 [Bacillus cereus NC7401]|nr:hypothetical protein BCN_3943 [Bacillus cereus NC7401]